MQCSARTDVCICDENDYLLVQEDKWLGNLEDPEPQLIAEAIAAYQRNNFVRDRVLHIPTLDEITFPCITLVETSLTFYKIKVTELSNAVMGGTFPANAVVVHRHTPRLPCRNSEGMTPIGESHYHSSVLSSVQSLCLALVNIVILSMRLELIVLVRKMSVFRQFMYD